MSEINLPQCMQVGFGSSLCAPKLILWLGLGFHAERSSTACEKIPAPHDAHKCGIRDGR